MSRENAESKGRRYVAEGRLVVEYVDEEMIHARCRGGGAVYDCGFDAGEWFCSCPAVGRCAHLVALGLVIVRPLCGDGGYDAGKEPASP